MLGKCGWNMWCTCCQMWLKPCHFVLLNLILKYWWTMYFLLLDMLPLMLIDLFEGQGYSCPDLYVLWLVWGEIVIIWAIVSFNKGICIYNGFEQRQTFLVVFSKVALLTVSYGKFSLQKIAPLHRPAWRWVTVLAHVLTVKNFQCNVLLWKAAKIVQRQWLDAPEAAELDLHLVLGVTHSLPGCYVLVSTVNTQ